MKSLSLFIVINLFVSTLGRGNRYLRISEILSPSYDSKPLNIKWGYASLIGAALSFKSCLNTTFEIPKYAVGPYGKWETIKPSGSPLVSCKIMISVKLLACDILTRSFKTYPPRLILIEFGVIIFISFWNWTSLWLGSLEVVIKILGSLYFASSYSSSMAVLAAIVWSSPRFAEWIAWSFSFFHSLGTSLSLSMALLTWTLFFWFSYSLASWDFV